MEKKMMIVMSMMLLIISANVDTVNSDAFDCYDACSTGCVNPDPRLLIRCDRKCRIKCDRGAVATREENGQ